MNRLLLAVLVQFRYWIADHYLISPILFMVSCLFSLLLCARKLFWKSRRLQVIRFPWFNQSQLFRDSFFLAQSIRHYSTADLWMWHQYYSSVVEQCPGKKSPRKDAVHGEGVTGASERTWCCLFPGIVIHSCSLSLSVDTKHHTKNCGKVEII